MGISGAPVTHWDGYDTHYTERYMGTPLSNPIGYDESSVMHHVPKMRDSAALLLVHGLIDENVHFRHTARLIDTLIRCCPCVPAVSPYMLSLIITIITIITITTLSLSCSIRFERHLTPLYLSLSVSLCLCLCLSVCGWVCGYV